MWAINACAQTSESPDFVFINALGSHMVQRISTMDANLLHLSKLLAKIPASAQVAAVFGLAGSATGRDGLAIRYHDGTENFHDVIAGSRPWLQALFPCLGWRAEYGLDADYQTWLLRFSSYQDALLTSTHCRVLYARTLGIRLG